MIGCYIELRVLTHVINQKINFLSKGHSTQVTGSKIPFIIKQYVLEPATLLYLIRFLCNTHVKKKERSAH